MKNKVKKIGSINLSFKEDFTISAEGSGFLVDDNELLEMYSKLVYFYKKFVIGGIKKEGNCKFTIKCSFVLKEDDMGFQFEFEHNSIYASNPVFKVAYEEVVKLMCDRLNENIPSVYPMLTPKNLNKLVEEYNNEDIREK